MRHCLVLIVLLAVLSSAPAAAEVVKLGLVGGGGNAGIFLADEEGYFVAEGLDVEITRFDAAAKIMAPLGTGELDVAVGAVSASFFNAIERKVDIKVIASLAQTVANDPYYALVVRKDLVDSGRFKSYADLKGLKAALGAPGVGVSSLLDSAAKAGGIQFSDIETVYLPMPQQVVAMQKGLIDATYIVDPFGSEMVSDGAGVRFASADAVYPHYQIAVFFCNEAFLQRPGQATGLLRAYLRGTRLYLDSIEDGRFRTGATADHVVDVLAKSLRVSPDQLRATKAPSNDRDARVNIASLNNDRAFLKARGDVKSDSVPLDSVVDLRPLQSAIASLTPTLPH